MMTNSKRLFYGSCFALITTAFSFSIRAGILPQLAETFSLSGQQLGFINSMWFLGFPISMILGGIFYHTIGPKRIMQFAFATHTLGIILTIHFSLLRRMHPPRAHRLLSYFFIKSPSRVLAYAALKPPLRCHHYQTRPYGCLDFHNPSIPRDNLRRSPLHRHMGAERKQQKEEMT